MIWKGKKCSSEKQLRELQTYINQKMSERFEKVDIVDDRDCFMLDSGEILSITCMIGEKFFDLCTEYADSSEDMRSYFTTDGDLYPPDEYDTPEDMLRAMLKEIEG